MPVRTERHLAYNYKSTSTMQHFLIRAFRLPALLATLFGVMQVGPVLAQQQLSPVMYFDGVGPQGGLVTDGTSLYGATTAGAYAPGGLLYRTVVSPPSITTLYEYGRLDVWTGANPGAALLLSSDGYMYGVTQNVSIDVLRGGSPVGAGTIFRVARDGTGYTKLFTFDDYGRDSNGYITNVNGAFPRASLIEGPDDNGVRYLYGTTLQAGSTGSGTVFRIHRDGSNFEVLHTFATVTVKNPGTGPLDFDLNPDGRNKNPDGMNPDQRLLYVDGFLYGVTTAGGVNGTGVVYKLPVDGSSFEFVPFAPSPVFVDPPPDPPVIRTNATGAYPSGGLTAVTSPSGMLYGTASGLGPNGSGTVFRVSTTGALAIEVMRSFTGTVLPTMGTTPAGNLIEANDGTLVGTTWSGGALTGYTAAGLVYKLTTDGQTYTPQCIFTQENGVGMGTTPVNGVVQTADGNFYGIAYSGGYGNGLIYKCGTPHDAQPLGIRPPLEDSGGSLSWWLIAALGSLVAVQIARRKRLN